MIKDRNIICTSNFSWFGESTRSTVQLLSRIACNNRVLFIEYPYTIKDLIMSFVGKNKIPAQRMLGIKKRLITIKTDVHSEVYNLVMPPVFPVFFIKNEPLFQLIQKLNIFIYRRCLKKIIHKLNFDASIIINAYNPFYGLPIVGKLEQTLDIYYCFDGYDTQRYGNRIYAVDQGFSKKADAVICSSEYIKQDKLKFTKNSFVVKNGVDYDIFKTKTKSAIHRRKNKIVGYIGTIDHRFYIDIVEYAVEKLSNFEFHFTGELSNPKVKERLSGYNNVKFFPSVPPDEVPDLLATYDVGIIPYTITEYNKNVYPLKINEYLAIGVPVVMTDFADLKDFEGMISVADNNESFVEKIINETDNDSLELIKKRTEFAKLNSWDVKAQEFGLILKDLLSK